MSKQTAKQEREREIFRRFAAVVDLPISTQSIRSCEPPQPDIRCKIEGEGEVWFEVAEACSEDMVRAEKNLPENGVFATWPGENTEDTVAKHIATKYESSGPSELLIYNDGRSPNSEAGLISSVKHVVKSGAGQFRASFAKFGFWARAEHNWFGRWQLTNHERRTLQANQVSENMTYHQLEPVDPREAFSVVAVADQELSRSVAASQAAFLLSLRAGVLGCPPESPDEKRFPLPELRPLKRRRHLRVDEACAYLGASASELRQETAPQLHRELTGAAERLYEKPSLETAAAMFEAAMHSPHPLVASAAAAGARETTRLRKIIRKKLVDGAQSDDHLASRVSEAAIGHIGPMHEVADQRVIERPKSRKRNRRSNTAVVTHGTFAANNDWYKPGGDFYDALNNNRPDLHLHDQSFTWTGSYSHSARQADAALLKQWITDQGLNSPDFFAHSHGATVAHLATRLGVQFDRLVLMGWPAREKWFPDFSKVNRIIDVRVRFDLVVLLDGGSQRFRTNQFNIEEHRNGWFDHSSTHESGYWDDHGLWGVV